MKSITTRSKQVEIPTAVDELTQAQYEYYCFLALALGAGTIDPEYFRVRWLSYLIGMGSSDYSILRPEFIAELDAQVAAVDSFFLDGHPGRSLDFNTTVNLLPEFAGYRGPADWLDGLTYGRFVQCLTIFESLAYTDARTVAEGYEEIARILYNIPEGVEVPGLLAFHAPTFFAAVWKAIQSGPIDINGRKIDFGIIFKNSGSRRADDKTGWTGITFEVASAGLFGNVKELEEADFWAVLLYLYKCKFEYLHDKDNHK